MQVGQPAPEFCGVAVMPNKRFREIRLSDFRGRWLVLFFYPLDFTSEFSRELQSYLEMYPRFRELNAEVIGCSVDSHFTHLNAIEHFFGQIGFPLISDLSNDIARNYGVLLEAGFSQRARFIIDPAGILRLACVTDNALIGSVSEILRVVGELQTKAQLGLETSSDHLAFGHSRPEST